jgi:KAP-like P-loop domain-containing protein/TIR domain-containing protein
MESQEFFFFFSYDRRDSECRNDFKKFFDMLSSQLSELAVGNAGFAEWSDEEPTERWPDEVAQALQGCGVFVPVYSRGYFASEYCGKEFQAFLNRLDRYMTHQSESRPRPRLVLPILWDNPNQLPSPPHSAIADFDYLRSELGREYYERGLNYFMRTRNNNFIDLFVQKHADKILELADRHRLPPLTDLPPLDSIPSAFDEPARQQKGHSEYLLGSLNGFAYSMHMQEVIKKAPQIVTERVENDGRSIVSGSLTTSCLLFALFDVAREMASYDATLDLLNQKLSTGLQEKYVQVVNSYFEGFKFGIRHARKPYEVGIELTVPQKVFELVQKAEALALATTKNREIHVGHFVAVLLFYDADGPEPEVRDRLVEMGVDLTELRESFLEFWKRSFPRNPDPSVLLGASAVEPLDLRASAPDFNADVYTKTDLLDIEDDVEAFARLIASRKVVPPLSVGLFGDWGSGKTFFMQHLKNRVGEIMKKAQESGRAQKEIDYYKRIVQIEFNAWHYGEGNLWASLVEHIFQNLTIEGESADAVKQRQEKLLKQLTTEQMAEQQAQAAEVVEIKRLEDKEKEIKDVEDQQEKEIDNLARLREKDIRSSAAISIKLNPQVEQQVKQALREAGIEDAYTVARDFQAALSEAKTLIGRGGNVLIPMLRAEDGPKRFMWLVIILIAGPLVGILIALVTTYLRQEISQLAGYASAAAALLGAGAAWVRKQTFWMSDRLKQIEEAKLLVDKHIEKQVAAVRSKYAKRIERHRQQLDLMKSKATSLRQEREAAQRRVEKIQAEMKQITPVQLLAGFIQDRAASDDYRKHLGVLALIRRDFEKLSDLMQTYNKSLESVTLEQEDADTEKVIRINRIVLYIDDLDRCAPDKVVAVLQAVHLLLAFPLFVVVVGVDERWVARSLRKQYRELLAGDGNSLLSATPRDYLEKIFQIPFWLEPMQDDSTKKMLGGLLEKLIVKKPATNDKKKEPAPQQNVRASRVARDAEMLNVQGEQKDADEEQPLDDKNREALAEGRNKAREQQGEPEDRVGGQTQRRGRPAPELDLTPKSLEIDDDELEYMQKLAPLLGKSPRAVKRFVNIYLLIKVGLGPEERAEFLRDTPGMSQFKIVMLLLAVATGMPSISRQFFESLMSEDYTIPEELIVSPSDSIKSDPEWKRLRDWLNNHEKDHWKLITRMLLAEKAQQISRYSFVIKQ